MQNKSTFRFTYKRTGGKSPARPTTSRPVAAGDYLNSKLNPATS
jgi:hypothetical protein